MVLRSWCALPEYIDLADSFRNSGNNLLNINLKLYVMKKRKIKNLLLVKSSVANLNGVKHQIKGGNSFDLPCGFTDFPEQCDPEFTQNRSACNPTVCNCTTPTNRGCNTNDTCFSFPPVCNSIDEPCFG